MDIVTLPPGQRAPADSDCISIERAPGGDYRMTGSVLDGEESFALVGDASYPSLEQAVEEGSAWAAAHNVAQLYVATSE